MELSSEEKARDYGNGVPMWSPYFRNPKDYVKQPLSGLAPDAYWFEQYGFRGGKLSEDQIRIQGYGVPSWSPYYRTGGPKNVAESLASRAEPAAYDARGVGGSVILSSVHYAGRRLPAGRRRACGCTVGDVVWPSVADTRFERVAPQSSRAPLRQSVKANAIPGRSRGARAAMTTHRGTRRSRGYGSPRSSFPRPAGARLKWSMGS